MNSRYLKIAVLSSVVVGASVAQAGVTAISGPTNFITDPNQMNYKADAYQANTYNYWLEQQGHTLANNLVVSILPPAGFPVNSTTHSGTGALTIAAGTMVDSHYFYYDPTGSTSAVARFKFDAPILGIITNETAGAATNHFMMSDFLMNPAVPVANQSLTHFTARGLEIGANDDYIRWIAADEIELHFTAASPGDQIRVLTAVPEPTTMAVLGLGGLLVARRRKRSA